jgi:hypothetical protein
MVTQVAVGTAIASSPPYRSVRAELPHTAPTLDEWRPSAILVQRDIYSEESMIGMKSGLTVQNSTDFVSESVRRLLIRDFSVGAPADSTR